MKNHVKKLEDEISRWPHVSVHEHRFGGHEFLVDKAEVGHAHTGGIVVSTTTQSICLSSTSNGLRRVGSARPFFLLILTSA